MVLWEICVFECIVNCTFKINSIFYKSKCYISISIDNIYHKLWHVLLNMRSNVHSISVSLLCVDLHMDEFSDSRIKLVIKISMYSNFDEIWTKWRVVKSLTLQFSIKQEWYFIIVIIQFQIRLMPSIILLSPLHHLHSAALFARSKLINKKNAFF